jgi:pSer/pThr/pTyr-binding forkhead associated (FHA) protein
MAKLTLKFEERVLREVPVGQGGVTIGRLPSNGIVIENPAVSGQHARIIVEGGQYVVEDLNSRNGTFVNNQPVNKHMLHEGDVIAIGKHTLVFHSVSVGEAPADTPVAASTPAATVQEFGGTVMLDTKAQKELMAKAAAAQAQAAATPGQHPTPPPPPKEGTLTVLTGSTDKKEYLLEAQTTLVGKAETAQVRLKGWFKPKMAAAITRKGASYIITPLTGKAQVNGQPLRQAYELKTGDILNIAGVSLQFTQSG